MITVKIDPLSLAILKCRYNGDISEDEFTAYKLLLDAIPLLLLSNVELRTQLAEKHTALISWIGKLAHVMNGGVLVEKVSNTVFFFDKPTIVPLPERKK